jgi:hypothetical protein
MSSKNIRSARLAAKYSNQKPSSVVTKPTKKQSPSLIGRRK